MTIHCPRAYSVSRITNRAESSGHFIQERTMISPIVLKKLATFDTPTICNIIELFDVRPHDTGYMDDRQCALR